MRERPILFSGPMVRAILDGRKVQTRRVVKWKHGYETHHEKCTREYARSVDNGPFHCHPDEEQAAREWLASHCPYGVKGDRLWVRETMRADDSGMWDYAAGGGAPDGVGLYLGQDDPEIPLAIEWLAAQKRTVCPAIHMPRWASRLTLEVTDVRVQRLQEISAADCAAEGVLQLAIAATLDRSHPLREAMFERGTWGPDGPDHQQRYAGAREAFAALWDSINAKRGHGWDTNPWVWALTFRVLASTPVARQGAQ